MGYTIIYNVEPYIYSMEAYSVKYCIGVDLGGTNIAAGLVDIEGKRIIRKMSMKTRAPRPCTEISRDIAAMCEQLCRDEKFPMGKIDWIGVATPGIVKNGVVISAVNLGWSKEPFGEYIASYTSRPTFVANDANAAAYAEALWGVGEDAESVVAITLGTGVGGGMVIDGRIWEGTNGFAAEIGHMIIDAGGRRCGCGRRGCLEAYCSASALVAESQRMMQLYPDTKLWQVVDGDPTRANGKTPFDAKRLGDDAGEIIVDSFIDYLAVGVANVINIFQPDVVCIGGGVSWEGDSFINPLKKKLGYAAFGTDSKRTRVELAKFRNDAGIIGAALLGLQTERKEKKDMISRIVDNFNLKGEFISSRPYGNGHINGTELVIMSEGDREYKYILQRINKNVFKSPALLMENYVAVTDFIRKKIVAQGGDPEREVINVIRARDGRSYYIDKNGDFWRMLLFVEGNVSYDKVERPEQFYESAVAFGNFQYMLRDYPAETLHETIVNFHNTPDRYRQLREAVAADACGRLSDVGAEVAFADARVDFIGIFERAREEGKLPLKVTHNDTKLNNILFDAESGKPLCVVDLDTIMPGYAINDFGDSIRFGATTAAEDETDLSLVNFDINLFELYVKGFIEGAKGGLTETEIALLPESAIMMTLECGMRFLTDYLAGDTYFKISRPSHNLDRARNQFKLVSDMEKQLDEMHKIVEKYAK